MTIERMKDEWWPEFVVAVMWVFIVCSSTLIPGLLLCLLTGRT